MMFDVAIVGAGIAGASLAAALAPHRSVLIIEAEDQPGYHSTGRSNALWHETYGGPMVAPMTTASKAFFDEGGFLTQRSIITLARSEDMPAVEQFEAAFANSPVVLERLDRDQLADAVPGLRHDWQIGVHEAACFDIDVAGFHAAVLGKARQAGAHIATRARLLAAQHRDGHWRLETKTGVFDAGLIVNAAGGWADSVAELAGVAPLGITAYRRTITQLRLATEVDPRLPFVIDINGSFYFRPEGNNRVWLSPHDETATPACDAAPEELDIAIAIDQFQQVVDWPIAAVERSWAGLRSFAPDRLPIYGFDPECPEFFWCAGQGGFGIQTAPAAARLCAALILGQGSAALNLGVNPTVYAPSRLSRLR
jgi:D-arginine dehydrogenase